MKISFRVHMFFNKAGQKKTFSKKITLIFPYEKFHKRWSIIIWICWRILKSSKMLTVLNQGVFWWITFSFATMFLFQWQSIMCWSFCKAKILVEVTKSIGSHTNNKSPGNDLTAEHFSKGLSPISVLCL